MVVATPPKLQDTKTSQMVGKACIPGDRKRQKRLARRCISLLTGPGGPGRPG